MATFRKAVTALTGGVWDGAGRVYSPANLPPGGLEPSFAPVDHGLKAWSMDPLFATANGQPTSGVLQIVEVPVRESTLISTLWVGVLTAGASLTNVGFAMYDGTTRLTQQVNSGGATAAAFQSGGIKTITLTTPQTVTGSFYAAFWFTGTTMPFLYKAVGASAMGNLNLAPPNLRFGIANTALTTTAPNPMGTQSTSGNPWWVGAA